MIKNQFQKIKENWVIAVLLVVLLVAFSFAGSVFSNKFSGSGYYGDFALSEEYFGDVNFEAKASGKRIVTQTSSLSLEIEKGSFADADKTIKKVVQECDSVILSEDISEDKQGRAKYKTGWYVIKIKSSEYDKALEKLKKIGEVVSNSNYLDDETDNYYNIETELANEKKRLARFQELYNEATEVKDKVLVEDKIFYQQRRVDYLEKQVKNINNRVKYTTLSIYVYEKKSEYADVIVASFSNLIKSLMKSVNALLHLFFIVLPWAVLLVVIHIVWVKFLREKWCKKDKSKGKKKN